MNEPLVLKDIQFKFMFGLVSNTFELPDINMDDYVQWNVTLHQLDYKNGGMSKNTTILDFHLCTEDDENQFYEPIREQRVWLKEVRK